MKTIKKDPYIQYIAPLPSTLGVFGIDREFDFFLSSKNLSKASDLAQGEKASSPSESIPSISNSLINPSLMRSRIIRETKSNLNKRSQIEGSIMLEEIKNTQNNVVIQPKRFILGIIETSSIHNPPSDN